MDLRSAIAIVAFSLPLAFSLGLLIYVAIRYSCVRSYEYIPLV